MTMEALRRNPWCLRCGRPVDKVVINWVYSGVTVQILTTCHGERAEAFVPAVDLAEDARPSTDATCEWLRPGDEWVDWLRSGRPS
jgi:hypothetical protein